MYGRKKLLAGENGKRGKGERTRREKEVNGSRPKTVLFAHFETLISHSEVVG